MRKIAVFCFFGSLSLAPCERLTSGEFKLEPGFTLLFNGKNLDGWRERKSKDTLEGKVEAFKGRFKVIEGVIDYDPRWEATGTSRP
jgi:hypothetical protein